MANIRDPLGYKQWHSQAAARLKAATAKTEQMAIDEDNKQKKLLGETVGGALGGPMGAAAGGAAGGALANNAGPSAAAGAETVFSPTPANPMPAMMPQGMQPSGASTSPIGMPQQAMPQALPPQGMPPPGMPPQGAQRPPQAMPPSMNMEPAWNQQTGLPHVAPRRTPEEQAMIDRRDERFNRGMGFQNQKDSQPYLSMLRQGRFSNGPLS